MSPEEFQKVGGSYERFKRGEYQLPPPTMLCSVMIPTRKRPEGLLAAIRSVSFMATSDDYEILVRHDDDDPETPAAIKEARANGTIPPDVNLRVFSGPLLGYAALDRGYYSGLEELAQGEFVWIAGDDMEVSGDWMGELAKVPKTGFIVQPATSTLGFSTYHRAEAQAFPIFPRFCWKEYAGEFPRPFDTSGSALLIANGWKTWFLEGVVFHHNEAEPEELEKHRAAYCTPVFDPAE